MSHVCTRIGVVAAVGALAAFGAVPAARASKQTGEPAAGVVVLASRVVYRSGPGKPRRFIIHGAFARRRAARKPGAGAAGVTAKLDSPLRGYMYFYCPKGSEARCQREWSAIADASGGGRCQMFGLLVPGSGAAKANGRVRAVGDKPSKPDPWPLALGVKPLDRPALCTSLRRARALAKVRRGGILALLGTRSGKSLSKIFGRGARLGVGGGLKGLAPRRRYGGLTSRRRYGGFRSGRGWRRTRRYGGYGRGGGGVGIGTIGLGRLGTIGKRRRRVSIGISPRYSRVSRGLDKNVVRKLMRRYALRLRGCYQRRLRVKPGLRGRLVLRFRVRANGRVTVRAFGGRRSTLRDRRMRACILAHMRYWRFPRPKGVKSVEVTYPVTFR